MRLILAAVFMTEHHFFLCRHLHFTPWKISLKHRNTISFPTLPRSSPCCECAQWLKSQTSYGACPGPRLVLKGYPCSAADPSFLAPQPSLWSKESKPISKESKSIRKGLRWLVFSEKSSCGTDNPSKTHFPEHSHSDFPMGRATRQDSI